MKALKRSVNAIDNDSDLLYCTITEAGGAPQDGAESPELRDDP